MVAALAESKSHPTQSQVVRFRAAACKYDFLGAGIQYLGDGPPRRIHPAQCILPKAMQAGRVAEFVRKVWKHCLDGTRIDRRRRGMIKVD